MSVHVCLNSEQYYFFCDEYKSTDVAWRNLSGTHSRCDDVRDLSAHDRADQVISTRIEIQTVGNADVACTVPKRCLLIVNLAMVAIWRCLASGRENFKLQSACVLRYNARQSAVHSTALESK